MLGQPAPTAVATHWYNAPAPVTPSDAAPGARQIVYGDGKIRVFEFGGVSCSSCLAVMPIMQKVAERFRPAVDVWYMSLSEQRWGAQDCTPDESAEHIRKYYVEHHKSKVPMAVWAPPVDDTTRARGAVLQRPNPTFEAYRIEAVPVFAVVDGAGRLRRFIVGGGSKLENDLVSILTFLIAEAKRNST
jgi:thiol-disulfide isomerase/thioredoxin